MIHERAKSSYKGPQIEAANYNLWVTHWFNTAEQIYKEFKKEYQWETCVEMRRIIDQQKSYKLPGTTI
jgi:hypothetical protein